MNITQGLNAEQFAQQRAIRQQQLSAMLGVGALATMNRPLVPRDTPDQYADCTPQPNVLSRETLLLLLP